MRNRKPHRFNRKARLFFFSCFLFFLVVSEPLFAGISKLGPAGKTVQYYCMLDSLGVQANSTTWHYLKNLAVWEDAPGWDGAKIIDHFEILKETYKQNKAQVAVRYHIVAEQAGEKTKKVNRNEVVIFELIDLSGEWKITAPQNEPYFLEEIANEFSDCKSLNSLYLYKCSQ